MCVCNTYGEFVCMTALLSGKLFITVVVHYLCSYSLALRAFGGRNVT